jgi:glycosyltransferase involved in cell wall biosynthesis
MKVSIIVTSFNRERFVSRAIRSAISQRFPRADFEVIVVDDASTDSSADIIKDFGDEVVPIFSKRNQGLAAARNAGIRRAKGRFVVHLDSDDYLHDELVYFEYAHLAMNPEWGAVSCDYYVVDAMERHLVRKNGAAEPIACGIMFRKDWLIEVGLYDPVMRMCEEEELRIRYASKFTMGHVQLPLYRYTKHEANMSADTGALAKYRQKIRRKHPEAAQANRLGGTV